VGAIVSGILQAVLSFSILFRDYHAFVDMRMAELPTDLLLKIAEKGGDPAITAFGPMFIIEYLFGITTILFMFWTIEGIVPAIAAIGAKETLPDLLLFLVAFLHHLRKKPPTAVVRGIYPTIPTKRWKSAHKPSGNSVGTDPFVRLRYGEA